MRKIILNISIAFIVLLSSCSKNDIDDTPILIKDLTVSSSHITSISALIDITTLNEASYYKLNVFTQKGDTVLQDSLAAKPTIKHSIGHLNSNTPYVVSIVAFNNDQIEIAKGESYFTTTESLYDLAGMWYTEQYGYSYTYEFRDNATGSYLCTEYNESFDFHWHVEDNELIIETLEKYKRDYKFFIHFSNEYRERVTIGLKVFWRQE